MDLGSARGTGPRRSTPPPSLRTTPRHRLIPTWANGQVAFGHYSWRQEPQAFVRHAITVLSLRGTEIAALTFFKGTEAFRGLALPHRIEAR
jgi:RNA polymerase sigma-70 factor (ECF subfamily)